MPRSDQRESALEKQNNDREILQDKKTNKQTNKLNISRKKVMDQCVLPTTTFDRQTWSLTKQLIDKL